MTGKQFSILLLFVALLGMAAMWWYSTLREQVGLVQELVDNAPTGIDVDIQAGGVTLSKGEAGNMLWRLEASSADYNQDNGTVRLYGPVIDYNADGKRVHVLAPEGVVDQKENVMTLVGGVDGRYANATFQADTLEYAGKQRVIILFGNASIQSEEGVITAPRFTFHLGNSTIVASEGVSFEFGSMDDMSPTSQENVQ